MRSIRARLCSFLAQTGHESSQFNRFVESLNYTTPQRLMRVWNQGSFRGNYGAFHTRIRAALPPGQSPNLFTLGRA